MNPPASNNADPLRAPMDFYILGEDDAFLAVDKPAGLLVHPTRPGGPPTLWDGLRDLLGFELATGGQISILNRLDRETSGVVVVAKSHAAARLAGMLMEERKVGKIYHALVFGHPDWTETTVDAPILRRGEVAPSPVHLERMVHPQGIYARTHFRVLSRHAESRGPFSLVEAHPETGRTHQIRVHLAHVGFPVIGDKLYARGSQHYLNFIQTGWTRPLEASLWLPRHALHCSLMKIAGRSWQARMPEELLEILHGNKLVSPGCSPGGHPCHWLSAAELHRSINPADQPVFQGFP